ncbi:MAG TPA: hypothetical protein VFL91_05640 [Thermomicrobiales bacterium]|nr:hypothetical protein [Thermomicrobiales bacterium]
MGADRGRDNPGVRWFAWREVRAAYAYARAGGIALHAFQHDLRRFGFGPREPACHILSADRAALVAFAARFGLREAWIEPPRPRRPDLWHFDAFGPALERLKAAYPPGHTTASAEDGGEAPHELLGGGRPVWRTAKERS